MQFSDILDQDYVKEKLVQMVQHNRLSHSLLFLGKEGSGDLSLAIAFAQYIVCTSSKKQKSNLTYDSLFNDQTENLVLSNNNLLAVDSCGTCPACLKAAKLMHPDIHFSYPVINKKAGEKPVSSDFIREWREYIASYPYGNVFDWLQFIGAENKQGNISSEECNDIIKKLSLKSFESNFKILIMWLPEYLGKEGNKLLKLIEEPPTDTIFIFVSENEQSILPTILSRTQLVKIPILTDQVLKDGLVTRANISEDKAVQIAGISNGNYRAALQLLQHAEEDWQELAREWLRIINRKLLSEQVKWLEDMSKLGREKQKQFLLYFIHLCEHAVRLRVLEESNSSEQNSVVLGIPEIERDFALRLNKLCSLEAQETIIEELTKCCYYIERNANSKMMFHALSIRLYYIIKDNSLILVN